MIAKSVLADVISGAVLGVAIETVGNARTVWFSWGISVSIQCGSFNTLKMFVYCSEQRPFFSTQSFEIVHVC